MPRHPNNNTVFLIITIKSSKNPLTAIKTFAEYLPEKLDDKEFLKKFSDIVAKEVNRIDELIHQLLDYGKPAELNLQVTDIDNLILETLDALNMEFIKHKIEVRKNFMITSNMIYLDYNQIKQVLINIFLNAIDAMHDGGILTIQTALKKNKITISITDTGPGIHKNDLPHIFEPFHSNKKDGTGLGLAISLSIIEKHRGKICAQSTLGEGSEFQISLPTKES